MKPRKVVLTVEMQSNEAILDLKQIIKDALNCEGKTEVVQIQANIIKK